MMQLIFFLKCTEADKFLANSDSPATGSTSAKKTSE